MTRDAEHTPSLQSVACPIRSDPTGICLMTDAATGAAETPLQDHLRRIPRDAIYQWVTPEADRELWQLPSNSAPIGRLAHEAADRIDLAALSPEAPAREGVEALRTALIKARSELAIQYCYSAGRMGIAGCYPELAEKYGGSAIVQEIDAVLALTPRHEAPASEGDAS